MDAWKQACWKHQRKGATMSGDARPGLLGRAMPVKQYASMLLDAAGIHTEEISQEALRNRTDYLSKNTYRHVFSGCVVQPKLAEISFGQLLTKPN